MVILDANTHSVFAPVQVQQATVPSLTEIPFLTTPVHKRSTFHYAHLSHHVLLRPIAHETGSKIYLQGEPICGFRYLNHGVIGLHHTLKNGREMLVHTCQQGDWFGHLELFGSEFYHYHAYVSQTTSLYHVIPHSDSGVLRYCPQFAQFLLNQAMASLSGPEHHMIWIVRYHTRHRVLGSLWYLTSYFPSHGWT